jgi:2'-5' RNA ligase
MPDTTRTFVALDLPQNARDKLDRLQSLLGPETTGVRWVEPNTFHLTLAFLGDVPNSDLPEVCRAVARAGAEMSPFDVRIEGLGVFPDAKRTRSIWVGFVGPGLENIERLQARVADEVARINYPTDDKFHPHITLGRLKPGRGPTRDLTPLLNHYRTWSPGSIRVEEAVTYSSVLTSDGPEYVVLGRARFKAGKSGTTA